MGPREEVPVGELVLRYEEFKGASTESRLKIAADLAGDPAGLAEMFDSDVRAFCGYEHIKDDFHSGAEKRDATKFDPSSKTRVFAAAINLFGDRFSVPAAPELAFRYVDREIYTARTLNANFGTTSEGQPRRSTAAPQLDLLLANAEDGTPIAAELKIGNDRDPFYALLQVLAHATMLATPNQLKRLHRQYNRAQEVFDPAAKKIDVYVLLVGEATASDWGEFQTYAERLSRGLMECEAFTSWVRRLAQVRLKVRAEVEVP